MSDNQVIVLTAEQLKQFAHEIVSQMNVNTDAQQYEKKDTKRYVYGLRGIRELFNVSHVTAQRYKNTFLAPAVMQRGKKIIVDVDKALDLYNQTMI